MGAAQRFTDDRIDDAEFLQVAGRHPHRFGSFGGVAVGAGRGLVGGAPQDAGAAFGRNHRVDRVFEHDQAVGRSDGDGAARHAFAGDRRNDRHRGIEEHLRRSRNRFGDAALLAVHARIGAGRIDQRHHRHVEAPGEFHQPAGLAIAFGAAHAEIVLHAGGGVVALFMADHHHRNILAAQPAQPADDRLILAKGTIAGQRREIFDQRLDGIGEMRPRRVTGHQRLLPWRQPRIGFGEQPPRRAFGVLGAGFIAGGAIIGRARLDGRDRLFEFEGGDAHSLNA